ncbi:DUF488 domain-containing protein [Trinickia soli]|jgi:uncharacterized protein YeaO (DUF488 family)|uniref:DUF488 domain-containing protein n=1 Tax=Trinickia soli TaxID=380675 RepID=A0A2N7VSZ1_9BURK|nr:DUF488 family protein [Trinickia soli]PMS20284.1 DUF488 domain-containing protein [Trinickia soli]CAB3716005.1 hypothetical protein LMG24076_04308 [Trinickia soli]
MKQARIDIARAYDLLGQDGRVRFLVDRMWPRGVTKDTLRLEAWLRDVAPSTALRRWFGHDPERWEEFRERYHAELDANPQAWQPLVDAAERSPVVLLFGARDREHNQAVVLREYLLHKLAHH